MKFLFVCCLLSLLFIRLPAKIQVEEDLSSLENNIDFKNEDIDQFLLDTIESSEFKKTPILKARERRLSDHRDILSRKQEFKSQRNRRMYNRPQSYTKMTKNVGNVYSGNQMIRERRLANKTRKRNKSSRRKHVRLNGDEFGCQKESQWKMVQGKWKWVPANCHEMGFAGHGKKMRESTGGSSSLSAKKIHSPYSHSEDFEDTPFSRENPGLLKAGWNAQALGHPLSPLEDATNPIDITYENISPMQQNKKEKFKYKDGPILIDTDLLKLRHDVVRFKNQNRHIQLIHSDQHIVEKLWKSLHVNFSRLKVQIKEARKYNGVILRTNQQNNLRNIRNQLRTSSLEMEDKIYRQNNRVYKDLNSRAKTFENSTLTNSTFYYETTKERSSSYTDPHPLDMFY